MSKKNKIFFSIIVLIIFSIIVISYLSQSSENIPYEEKSYTEEAQSVSKTVFQDELTKEMDFEKLLKHYIKIKDFKEAENALSIYFESLKKDESKFGESEKIRVQIGLYYKLKGLFHIGRSLNIESLIENKSRQKFEQALENGAAIIALEASLRYYPDDQSVKELLSTIKK